VVISEPPFWGCSSVPSAFRHTHKDGSTQAAQLAAKGRREQGGARRGAREEGNRRHVARACVNLPGVLEWPAWGSVDSAAPGDGLLRSEAGPPPQPPPPRRPRRSRRSHRSRCSGPRAGDGANAS
jgi:hypothetical protein